MFCANSSVTENKLFMILQYLCLELYLHGMYCVLLLSEYKGKFTVPVLWDKQMNTMVNNKSKDILRILNTNFQEFCATAEQRQLDLYPSHLRDQIDEYTDFISPYVTHLFQSILRFLPSARCTIFSEVTV